MPLALALSLSACGLYGQPPPGPDNFAVLQPAVVEDSRFDAQVTILGSEEAHDLVFHGVRNPYRLRSWVDRKSKAATHQVYVEHFYVGVAKEWHAASDDEARPLRFVPIRRERVTCAGRRHLGGCTYAEVFAAMLDEETLKRRSSSSYSIRFRARSGDEKTVILTNAQINEQLRKVEEVRAVYSPATGPR